MPDSAEILAALQLTHGVLRPADAAYKERQDSYWSEYSKGSPTCILRPASAQEVSAIVAALAKHSLPFAIRSGGHTQWHGASDIDGGVQLDLCFLSHATLDTAAETAELGPGAQWKDVYAALEPAGFTVAGGRNGKVGVGGLLLGGGVTFFAGVRGFGCDDVLAYEVVLGDGRIVVADADRNADLFRALKGGSGNFGIVTNFTMRAFRCDRIWGGLRMYPRDAGDDAMRALVDFTTRAPEDPDSHLLLFLAHFGGAPGEGQDGAAADKWPSTEPRPGNKDIDVAAVMINVGGVPRAPAFATYSAMPSDRDTTKMTTVREIVTEYDPAPNGNYAFYTLTLANALPILQHAAAGHEALVSALADRIPSGDFITECLFQPLPTLFGQRSKERGDNVLGLSSQPADGVIFVAVLIVKSAEHEKFAYPMLKSWGEDVRDVAAKQGALLPWVYLNYADKGQEPLASYGKENVEKMRSVAGKYDPEQVFQRLSPGGFKLSDVA